jgi:cyclophilin family peptidyl-prolyl cis-trans isomerase
MSVSMHRTRAVTRAGIALAATAFLAGLVLAQAPPAAPKAEPKKEAAAVPSDKPGEKKDVAVIKTNMGTIVFEFLPDVAPKMVANFKDLAKSGFYNGTTFHRVMQGFMIQGGDPLSKDNDPTNDGNGSSPNKMPAEFTTKYSHVRGMVSTARLESDVNSGSCQFFIVHKDSTFLDNQYTIFGRVTQGMDVVDKIAAVPVDGRKRPLKNVTMESVTIETR